MSLRPRFHLSTALLVMLTAGGLLFLNVRNQHELRFDDPDSNRFGEFVHEGEPGDIAIVPLYCVHGWPWTFQSRKCDIVSRFVPHAMDEAAVKKQFDNFPASDDERQLYRASTGFDGNWQRRSLLLNAVVAFGILIAVGFICEWFIAWRARLNSRTIPFRTVLESE